MRTLFLTCLLTSCAVVAGSLLGDAVLAAKLPAEMSGTGWGSIKASQKISAKKVGSAKEAKEILDIYIPDGTHWIADDEMTDWGYWGTYQMTGPTSLVFTYAPEGEAALEETLEDFLDGFVGPVTVDVTAAIGVAKVKAVDGDPQVMKYKFTAVFTATAILGSTTGKYQVKGTATRKAISPPPLPF
jgi:hypothetical protein